MGTCSLVDDAVHASIMINDIIDMMPNHSSRASSCSNALAAAIAMALDALSFANGRCTAHKKNPNHKVHNNVLAWSNEYQVSLLSPKTEHVR